ncbi:MAG TPA: clostripain-related cysteine peptidase, partial [Pyrinomonadaceae bacterium]
MPNKKAAWTVMVYLAGDNNLTTECLFALMEMKKASPGEQINVIAQFDPYAPYLPTHRYEINKGGNDSTLVDDIIDQASYDKNTGEVHFTNESRNAIALAAERRIGRRVRHAEFDDANLTGAPHVDEVITDDTDTGSPITLYNFISFCLENYEAEHYMVVLSGHAGGTERDYLLKDEGSARSLTFNELKQVFKRIRYDRKGKPIDIVGMDNCLMSMGEICYELRGSAKIVIGCESFSPASGWPYREILERLRRDFVAPTLSREESVAAEAAKAIVEEYANYYSNYWIAGMSVAQSALDLTKVEKLRQLVDKLAKVMEKELVGEYRKRKEDSKSEKTSPFQNALVLAHWEAQSYNGEQFVDLFDFCDCMENRVPSGVVAEECRKLKEFIRSEFVLKSCYHGAAYQYSYGVSLYFPWSQVAGSYWNLDFIRNSRGAGWGSFLRTYTLLTRRDPRGLDSNSELGVALAGAVERRFTLIQLIEERMTEERMTEERMTEERMTEERMTEERMTEERMTEERMTEERMTEERMTEERMTEERMTEERMTEERMT